jgi:diguanylate cyclase (GGDEF)-like protein/PAS domain S-box-containing protein
MTEAYVAVLAALTAKDRLLLEMLPCYIFMQRGGDVTYVNHLAREALGVADGVFFPVESIFEGAFPGLAYGRGGGPEPKSKNIFGSGNQAYTSDFYCRLRVPSGPAVPLRGSFRVLRVDPEVELLIVAQQARQEGQASSAPSHFLEQLLDAAPEAIMITRGARILHVNREFESLFGFSADEAVGRNTFDILIPETRRHEFDMLEHAMQLYGRASLETVRLHKSGDLIDVSVLVAPIELSGVEVGNFVSYRDIRDKKQNDAKLQYDAVHDSLTGLANRVLFLDRLQLTMARQHRHSNLNFAVMFLDLDQFKAVNDTLGHASGDDLLIRVAARLRACFRPEDTVARFGGDEFAILIEDVVNISDVTRIAERVQRDIRLPIEVYGHEVSITASIGIAFGTLDHATSEQVLRDADYAMYQAKSHGQARHEVFDNSMHVHVAVQMEKEKDLKGALDREEFAVWYQPIYRLADGEIEGFEALLRWRRPDGSIVPLQEFLPTAEETGLILPIGFFVLEQVTKQLAAWASAFPKRSPSISVNLSPRQFKYPHLLDRLAELLAQSPVPPGRLRLEVTENAINQDPDYAIAVFQRMVDLGVSAALDNFGVGLASMNHFVRLPIDLVKIDRRLISQLPASGRQAVIVQTIFDLGRLLQVRILGEGIERVEQLEALQKYNCDLVQGHLFSLAVPREQARDLLKAGRWSRP